MHIFMLLAMATFPVHRQKKKKKSSLCLDFGWGEGGESCFVFGALLVTTTLKHPL